MSWGQLGTALGPTGTALGIVIGGVGTSAWNWYWDQPPAKKAKVSSKPFTRKFNNFYEKAGYVHNKFIIDFINEKPRKFKDPKEFVDTLYEPLSQTLSKEYDVPIREVHEIFSREKLIKDVDNISVTFDESNKEVIIRTISDLISKEYGNTKISDYISHILRETSEEADNESFDIERYINEKIERLKSDNSFDESEKEILFNSLNIYKYSYALWESNFNEQ